jgi:hypothetical protein
MCVKNVARGAGSVLPHRHASCGVGAGFEVGRMRRRRRQRAPGLVRRAARGRVGNAVAVGSNRRSRPHETRECARGRDESAPAARPGRRGRNGRRWETTPRRARRRLSARFRGGGTRSTVRERPPKFPERRRCHRRYRHGGLRPPVVCGRTSSKTHPDGPRFALLFEQNRVPRAAQHLAQGLAARRSGGRVDEHVESRGRVSYHDRRTRISASGRIRGAAHATIAQARSSARHEAVTLCPETAARRAVELLT